MAIFSNEIGTIPLDTVGRVKLLTLSASNATDELTALLKGDAQVELDVVSSLHSFKQLCGTVQCEYHGMVIDLGTFSVLKAEDKNIINAIARNYPVCLVRKTSSGSLSCSLPACSETFSFQVFVSSCQNFRQPQTVRLPPRYELHLNVTLSKVMQSSILASRINVSHEQVVTLNVSMGGAYILTNGDYSVGDIVNLSMPVLGEMKSVRSEVRWVRKWDVNSIGLPGIGVLFTNMSERQSGALERLLLINK